MKPIDVHTHLSCEDFDADRSDVMARALAACDVLIDIGAGTSPDASERARKLSETYPQVYFTAGVHPHDAETLGINQEIREKILELAKHPKCVAIGECGLDYYYENSKPNVQMEVFRWHLEVAKATGLPLMIHTRDAEPDTIEILRDYPGHAIFHCFTGSDALADFGVSKGFYISFSGIVTFKNAEALRQTFLRVPLEHILIETDSPYLAPVPMRGKRNESSFLPHTAEFLAKLKGVDPLSFIGKTRDNSLKVFSKISLS